MRSLFRIHLSTAIVLMLLAAVFLGLNLHWFERPQDGFSVRSRGWPFQYHHEVSKLDPPLGESRAQMQAAMGITPGEPIEIQTAKLEKFLNKVERHHLEQLAVKKINPEWTRPAAMNAAIALLTMVLGAVLMERHLRKRAV